MQRILVYSHDNSGLGNIRCMLEVARHLVQTSAEVTVRVIADPPLPHAFRMPERIDYVRLSGLLRDTAGCHGARSLPLSKSLDDSADIRANPIRAAIADFAPDLILVDKMPFGFDEELAGALRALPDATWRPRLVLLLRDVLDSAESATRIQRKNGGFEAIDACYDQVLVLGCPEVYDLRRECAFPPLAAAKLRFCGYVAREGGRQPREVVRRSLGVTAGEPLLLVTPGGGKDGQLLVSTALAALTALPPRQRPRTHVVCGPEMGEADRDDVHRAALALYNVSVQDSCDDMMSLMAGADVVLAMGGYNTVCELLTLRKRALLVPRPKPGQEQCIRAERLAALGLMRTLQPELLGTATLMAALQAELTAWSAQQQPPALRRIDGLARVTQALFELLGQVPVAPAEDASARPPPARLARTRGRAQGALA